ncbi:unnamed protein product [Rangifer tarandus platyrhynchus]|uniref:Uncharacterized protein n=2 Tax=Rangifer tarandus platyrhynchus TaxID=3082113 RepID=A0ABN8ZLB5_RANTA|nr:unnamed protein product [Rangifer tarandus platyrhynchus]CAI9708314.1 unnamed protein product [Rangifer tarandus platyrhynchus]
MNVGRGNLQAHLGAILQNGPRDRTAGPNAPPRRAGGSGVQPRRWGAGAARLGLGPQEGAVSRLALCGL